MSNAASRSSVRVLTDVHSVSCTEAITHSAKSRRDATESQAEGAAMRPENFSRATRWKGERYWSLNGTISAPRSWHTCPIAKAAFSCRWTSRTTSTSPAFRSSWSWQPRSRRRHQPYVRAHHLKMQADIPCKRAGNSCSRHEDPAIPVREQSAKGVNVVRVHLVHGATLVFQRLPGMAVQDIPLGKPLLPDNSLGDRLRDHLAQPVAQRRLELSVAGETGLLEHPPCGGRGHARSLRQLGTLQLLLTSSDRRKILAACSFRQPPWILARSYALSLAGTISKP